MLQNEITAVHVARVKTFQQLKVMRSFLLRTSLVFCFQDRDARYIPSRQQTFAIAHLVSKWQRSDSSGFAAASNQYLSFVTARALGAVYFEVHPAIATRAPRRFQMNRSRTAGMSAIAIRNSTIHGKGLFATRKIAAAICVIEYTGEHITPRQALKRDSHDPNNPYHTFYFSLDGGRRLIDGAVGGNAARWINHGCTPNCQAIEEQGRIFIYALRDIRRGEELQYDYRLLVSERHTPGVKRAYACLCNTPNCRQTMLALKRKSRRS